MNRVQKAIGWMLHKATGFPSWNTTNIPNSVLRMFSGAGGADQLSIVYGCCRVRGQTIGSVPWHVYREDPKTGKREKDFNHPLYAILHDTPNDFQTSFEFRECMERSFCLWGNAYAEIKRNPDKRVTSLRYLRPDRLRVQYTDTGIQFEYSPPNGQTRMLQSGQVLHVKNFSDDGLVGQSPLLRYVMEHALAAQSFGLNFLKNGARPSGYLQHKKARPTSEGEVEKYKSDWQSQYGGPDNAGKTPVLWNEAEYKTIGVPPDEAQLLETVKRLEVDISGQIYGVPSDMLGIETSNSTYASAEQRALDFVKHCVRPQAVRYEQAVNKVLLKDEANVYCELDLDGLQRGDSLAQASYFSQLTQNGIMTRNEARRKLNLPEIKGADELTVQSNLIDLDKLAAVTNRTQLPATSSAGGNI